MNVLIILLATIFLAGCASAKWEQEGKSSLEVEQDIYVCEDAVLKAHDNTARDAQVAECMKKLGYRKIEK